MTNIAQHAFNTQNKVTVLSDGSKLFSSDFDSKCKFDIHRFDQIKFLRKRIKSSFAQNFLNKNKIDIIFFDSWKSLELFNNTTDIRKICLAHGNEILKLSDKNRIVNRKGAKENDLLVVSGDLGGAYVGLQVLEREKAVFKVNPNTQPDLSKYSYCIEKQLKPEARMDVIKLLDELEVIPTSMIDISDGLSSEILHLSKSSNVGFHLFEEKIPIDPHVNLICEEFKFNPTIAALNGGEDYELLFTISQNDFDKIKDHPFLTVIGHACDKKIGCQMTKKIFL